MARDLLASSGSVFVQIGDENAHRVLSVLEEVFGNENSIALITVTKTTSATSDFLPGVSDFVLWFARSKEEAWESLHSDTSRPFDKPKSGRIAVKVINHLGDEEMKVFRVE